MSTDVKGKGRADDYRRLNSKAAATAEVAKREAELRALYVVVPPGDEAKPISCPICKETMKSEFLEDDEDWVWKNAIKKDDRVCILLTSNRICQLTRCSGDRCIMQHVIRKPYHRQVALQHDYELNLLPEAVWEAVLVHLKHSYQQHQFHIRSQHRPQQT